MPVPLKSKPEILENSNRTGTLFVGAAHMDRLAFLDDAFLPGASNPGSVKEYPGGAMLNSASVYSALGGRAKLISITANDAAGTNVTSTLTERHITPHLATSSIFPTATYTALHTPDGGLIGAVADMHIYDTLTPDVLAELNFSQLVNGVEYCCVDCNIPATILPWIAENVGAAKLAVASTSVAKARRLLPIIDQIDLLFTNRGQAEALCEIVAGSSANSCAQILAGKGVKSGIISDGAESIICWQNQDICQIEIPDLTRPIHDVTGAGDALAGVVLYCLGQGKSFGDAIEEGIRWAQLTLYCEGPYCPDLMQQLGSST